MSPDKDGCALHGCGLNRFPGPFVDGRVIDIVVFDARVIALIGLSQPFDKNTYLDVMNPVLADNYVRCICHADTATAGRGAIVADFKAFDPEPVLPFCAEGLVEHWQLPGMLGWIIRTAHIEPQRFWIKEPAFF